MAKPPANIAASIRQRLLNLARENGRDFQTILVAFGLERLIYRLSKSAHRDKFVLKGGMLVTL
jgi:predicted nucleotidyltransferase component of viral defense system